MAGVGGHFLHDAQQALDTWRILPDPESDRIQSPTTWWTPKWRNRRPHGRGLDQDRRRSGRESHENETSSSDCLPRGRLRSSPTSRRAFRTATSPQLRGRASRFLLETRSWIHKEDQTVILARPGSGDDDGSPQLLGCPSRTPSSRQLRNGSVQRRKRKTYRCLAG